MKRIVCSILFIFFIVWGWNTMEKCIVPIEKKGEIEKTETSEASQHRDQAISVLTAANSYADVSGRTISTFSVNVARRYRPAGFSFDKFFEYLTAGQKTTLDNTYKITFGISQVYAAHLKNAGYYIYMLRKIII